MRYGLPFQGSKNKLAERIVGILPRATHLYDVFAGGCGVTHCALLSHKWKCVHFSDIYNSVVLFRDCIEGNLPDGSEWISREDFFARKDTDPYVRILWSFGNNQLKYIYGRDIEPYKKAVHEMIFAPTPNERRLKFKEVCRLIPSVLVKPSKQRVMPTITSNIELDRLQSEERRRACIQYPFFGGEYEMRVADYRDIEILPDSIIYADPPYKGTTGYNGSKMCNFDHESFYDWCEAQEVPVFISEYWMPEDRFKCIAEWERTSTFSATNNALKKLEKLFVPNKWYDKFRPIEQKTLFDEL